jgi:hypothetical protein
MKGLRRHHAGAVAIVVAAALLRLPGLSTELWLDELLSLQNVTTIDRWWEVFTRLRQDNTHHLTSLWLFLLGPAAPAWGYRLPAYVGSLVGVMAAYGIGARESRAAAAACAATVGGSFLLIYYASEARGYGTLAGAVLVAWWLLLRFAETRSWRDAAGFWTASITALLSHPTAVWFLIGAYVWADVRLTRAGLRRGTRDTWRLFSVPALAAAVFYVVALRGQQVVGGPPWTLGPVLAETLSATGSGPLSGPAMMLCAVCLAGLIVLSLAHMRRQGDDRWIFYLVTGLIAPAAFIVLMRPPLLFPRYFTVAAVVLLMPVGSYIARLPSVAAASVLTVYLAGALTGVAGLAGGRSHYRDAVRAMTMNGPARVGAYPEDYAGHQWRTALILWYYGGPAITVAPPSEAPEWLIVEGIDDAALPHYVRRGVFPTHRFTAPSWTIYARTVGPDVQ